MRARRIPPRKTSDSIEQQEERKAARDNADQGASSLGASHCKPNVEAAGRKSNRCMEIQAGQSGNPTGKAGRHDLAAEIARAAFENNADAP